MTEVLIIGAGPVGLMLAGDLCSRGCRVRIIDARATRSKAIKALGITPRTLEVFDQVGLLEKTLDVSLAARAMNTVANDEIFDRAVIEPGRWPYEFLTVTQPDIEGVLESRLLQCGGRIERQCRLVGFQETAEGVAAVLETPDGTQTLTCGCLVGCDGAHSTVRKQLGLAFDGDKYHFTFLVADVELDWGRTHADAWKIAHMEGDVIKNLVAVIPIPGNERRYRVSMIVGMGGSEAASAADLPAEPGLDIIREILSPVLPGVTIDQLRWSSVYGVSHRLVPTYQVGRVFLAGDAAHIHPPIGGLGMNTGLQDAFNLSWKLALTKAGIARDSLLESYTQERHAVGESVVQQATRRMDDAFAGRQENEAAEIDAGTQLDISYQGSGIVGGQTDLSVSPGDRLPWCDGLTRSGTIKACTLIDQLRDGRFRLLAYAPESTDAPADALFDVCDAARARLGDQVGFSCIGPPANPPALSERVPVLIDSDGQAKAAFGDTAILMLVRPDGHLSWVDRWSPAAAASLQSHLEILL